MACNNLSAEVFKVIEYLVAYFVLMCH